jgi:hypothetical protein
MNSLRVGCLVAVWLGSAGSAWAAGPGLAVGADDPAWARWQARVQLTSEAAPSTSLIDSTPALGLGRTRSAALFGDYFVARPWVGEVGGPRVTSGLLVGQRGAVLGPGGAGLAPAGLSGHVARMPGVAPGAGDNPADATLTWPYLGVGYSGGSLRNGLSFSADLGLAAQNPAAIRFGRVGAAGFEDWARDLRLTPVLQLGVSYSF